MYAKWYFYLASPPEGSQVSRYHHYKQAEKSGAHVPQLQGPEMPDSCVNAWDFFCSTESVTYSDIYAYQNLTGEEFSPWEIDLIMTLCRIRRNPELWQLPQKS